jgi:hypothetical protein
VSVYVFHETAMRETDMVEEWGKEIQRMEIQNSFRGKDYYNERVREVCCVGVPLAAAVLDEHVLDWHQRITRPLNMGCIRNCVLGQVFDPNLSENEPKRRFFGLFSGKRERDGFTGGLSFFHERGIEPEPFVFAADEAIPFWEAEVARRS